MNRHDYESADKDISSEEAKQKQNLCEQYHQNNREKIVDYFMNIKDKVEIEELRFREESSVTKLLLLALST